MGFQRGALKLKFEQPDLEGLEIRIRRLSLGDALRVTELAGLGESIAQQRELMDELAGFLAKNILTWNLEDEQGNAVPIVLGEPGTKEQPSTGLYNLDVELILAIVASWLDFAAGVSPPLPQKSNSSEPSPGQFDLTAALSQNQESLPEPD